MWTNTKCVDVKPHTGLVSSYQATVIYPLISVQIKARSMTVELCWLITRSCKGFWSLSMASGPHPHSRNPVIRAMEDLTSMEMRPTITNTQLAYVHHDWLASALPDFTGSLQRRHLWASRLMFGGFIPQKHTSLFLNFYDAFHIDVSSKMSYPVSGLFLLLWWLLYKGLKSHIRIFLKYKSVAQTSIFYRRYRFGN